VHLAIYDQTRLTIFSQLSLLQFRDDSKLRSENIEKPSEELERRLPVFFFRVSLARLINTFSRAKSSESQQSPTSFDTCLNDLSEGITALKDSIPLEWRPEHEIFVDPTKHPYVFALHLEYHMLQMQIFTARKASASISKHRESLTSTGKETGCIEEDQITSYIASARKIFQIIGGFRASPRLNTAMKWL
jgi:hypothetical protein